MLILFCKTRFVRRLHKLHSILYDSLINHSRSYPVNSQNTKVLLNAMMFYTHMSSLQALITVNIPFFLMCYFGHRAYPPWKAFPKIRSILRRSGFFLTISFQRTKSPLSSEILAYEKSTIKSRIPWIQIFSGVSYIFWTMLLLAI